jgi:serine/threonine-protein kinase
MSTAAGQGEGLVPGTVLGRYEIGRQLGRGGMGAVYEAVHRDLKKRVAVKVLFGAAAASEEAKQRFLREGEAASRIRHPHVVDVTDVGSDGTRSYLVMEFLEGEDLASRLHRGLLTPEEAADILLPVMAGVAAAHDEGVVHRDLKPENIFLARQRHGGIVPKVLDFGVSKVSGDARAMTGTAATFGTPFYMPPEQLRGARQADHKSDQYALGVVLYECVVGRRPFEAENIYSMLRAIGDGDYPPPRRLRPELPEELEAIIMRAMNMDPAQRFPTLRQMGQALLPFAGDTARVLWADTFSGRSEAPTPRAISAGMTIAMPPSSGGATPPRKHVSGTRILPPDSPQSPVRNRSSSSPSHPTGTTLGTATGQRLDSMERPPRSRVGLVVTGVIAAGVGAFVVVMLLLRQPAEDQAGARPGPAAATAPTPSFRVEVAADPPTATLELDGDPAGIGTLRRTLPKDGSGHRLVAHAPGYRDAIVRFTDEPPPPRLNLEPVPPEAPPTTVVAAPAATRPEKATPSHPHHHHPAALPAGPRPVGDQPTHATPAGPVPANGAPVID